MYVHCSKYNYFCIWKGNFSKKEITKAGMNSIKEKSMQALYLPLINKALSYVKTTNLVHSVQQSEAEILL